MGTDPAYGLKCPCCRLELQRKWTRTHPHGNVGRGQSVHFPQDFLECGLYRKTHRRGLAEIQIPGHHAVLESAFWTSSARGAVHTGVWTH